MRRKHHHLEGFKLQED